MTASPTARTSNVGRAALWMALALCMFSMVAITGREAGSALAAAAGNASPDFIDTLHIMLVRGLVGLVLVLAVIVASPRGLRVIELSRIRLHAGRNGVHYLAQFCWFHALGLITLSQLFALEFTSPLWVALFAWALLGERFTALRGMAVVCGFIGMLVVVQPQTMSISLGSAFALTAAIGFALSMIATKRLIANEDTLCILFHMSWMQLAVSALLVAPVFEIPTTNALLWMIGVGVTSTGAHFALANAFREADAMIVAPMDFLRLPLIAAIGVLVYGEAIAPEVAIGATLILLANVLNLWGQSRIEKTVKPAKT